MLHQKLRNLTFAIALLAGTVMPASAQLTNGNFEAGTTGWFPFGTGISLAVDTVGAQEGAQCGKVTVVGSTSGFVQQKIWGPMNIKGKTLRLSGWVKTAFGTGGAPSVGLAKAVKVANVFEDYTTFDVHAGDVASWTKLQGVFTLQSGPTVDPGTTPTTDFLSPRLIIDATGVTGDSSIWMDDFKLEEVTVDTTNMLTNGSFELGTGGWDMYYSPSNSIETTGAKEGSQCLKVVTAANNPNSMPIGAYTGAKYAPGKIMHASAWVKTQFGTGGTPSVSIHRTEWNEVGAAPVPVYNAASDIRYGEQASWTQLHAIFNAAAKAGGTIWIMPNTDTTGVTGDSITWWDDVRLEEYTSDPINQLVNPSFELGTAGWEAFPVALNMSAQADAAAHEGASVLKVVVPAGGNGQVKQPYSGPLFYIGSKLRVWAWVKATYPAAGGYAAIYKDAMIAGAWGNDFGNLAQIDGNLSEWTKINAYTTCNAGPASKGEAPIPGEYLDIRLCVDCTAVTGGSSTVYWDDAMLAEPYLVPVELSGFVAE